MCLLQINKKNCLHCGHGFASYCEKCYQDLISENARLQLELTTNIEQSKAKAKIISDVIKQKNKYINDLEYIRDCYYKEIAARYRRQKNN